jgi:predicted RNA-binding protein YlxR (DUF448 family)
MCACCRTRDDQKNMLRLQCKDKKLQTFDGIGRSFYICNNCLEDEKKLEKALYRECKNKDGYLSQLKEMLIYVR